MIWYGILQSLVTCNDPKFVARLFKKLRLALKFDDLTTTAYHSQASGQVGHYNKTFVAHLRHYTSNYQQTGTIMFKR